MRIRRVLLGAALVAGLSSVPALSGSAVASANMFHCTFYLLGHGYGGKIVDIGCNYGAQGNQVVCEGSLRLAGVPEGIIQEACRRAALP